MINHAFDNAEEAAEHILENIMKRKRWRYEVRDELAKFLRECLRREYLEWMRLDELNKKQLAEKRRRYRLKKREEKP